MCARVVCVHTPTVTYGGALHMCVRRAAMSGQDRSVTLCGCVQEEDLEEIFEDHLCDYPLVILTSGICLETKTKYYGKFFKKQSEQALNKLLLKLKKKHRKADKSYVIWHEYKLESNAEPL